MNNLILDNYKQIITNQIRLKFIKKNIYPKFFFKKFYSTSFHFKIDSFKNLNIIESLYLFHIIYKEKSYISYFKKKYKEYDLIISLNLLNNKYNYFIFIWLLFIFPIIYRRNIQLNSKFLKQGSFVFSQKLYNIYPFIPNVYFSLIKPISHEIHFSKKNKMLGILLCKYYNFS